eukprot:SM000031S11632  [mRNA]  locus=s31:846315:848813:+ [translate_table: standard]
MVETAMLAAAAGLAFFLSSLLRLDSYLGFFFPLPIVISAVKWGAARGRKTMVATAVLLLVLAGPVKALSYMLMHGSVGLALGSFWRWRVNWWLSIIGCAMVRCSGAVGFVLLTSWLLRQNLFKLIMLSAHASISQMLSAVGSSAMPSMAFIYGSATVLVTLNCAAFAFGLHVLYAMFLPQLGLAVAPNMPAWTQRQPLPANESRS